MWCFSVMTVGLGDDDYLANFVFIIERICPENKSDKINHIIC